MKGTKVLFTSRAPTEPIYVKIMVPSCVVRELCRSKKKKTKKKKKKKTKKKKKKKKKKMEKS